MKFGTCKLCLEDKELIHSHVFSEFLYEPTYDEGHKYISVSSHPHHKTKPFQVGLREYLLCRNCEGKIGAYEGYAAGILRQTHKYKTSDGRAIVIPDFDYTSFKLFGLSLIWRCHITSLHMFSEVNLGPHTEQIRKMLHDADPGKPSQYCFTLIKLEGVESANTVIHAPAKTRFKDHNAYIFMAYGFDWLFVISSHSSSLPKDYPFVGMKSELVILTQTMSEKGFIQEMRRRMGPELIEKSKRAP
jgi:hypothetical protein